ncbi:MAG: LacI family DNA-binding transcriptional regulator [Bacteroidetes bacterium]|nr:LacI family DNA-binding transcriptional regulator [Bacteroidota bacterium]
MENSKEITIYDIAKSLDLSPSTVSKALNDDPAINKKTKKKIFDKAAEMGYRSNLFARNLRQQNSLTIGVIANELNSSFTTPLLSGIETVANEAGYGIILTDSSQSPEKEAANAQSLFQRRVDGVIAVLAPATDSFEHFRPFREKNIPMIFVDRDAPFPESTSVVIDNLQCGRMATMHLIGQGCRRIVHLTPDHEHSIYRERYKGYRDALAEGGITFENSWLVVAEGGEEASEKAARKILAMKPLPDGVFAAGDLAAAVCIRTFQEQGRRVPQDIAVVGFNNEVIGKLISPGLTTINYPAKEMGAAAAGVLVNHLKGAGRMGSISTLTIRADLIVRQSSLRKG